MGTALAQPNPDPIPPPYPLTSPSTSHPAGTYPVPTLPLTNPHLPSRYTIHPCSTHRAHIYVTACLPIHPEMFVEAYVGGAEGTIVKVPAATVAQWIISYIKVIGQFILFLLKSPIKVNFIKRS